MQCTDPFKGKEGGRRTPPMSSRGFGSKLPLPLYADVRSHIPITHRNDRYRKMKGLKVAKVEKASLWGKMRKKVTEKSSANAGPLLNLTKAASILLGQQALAGTETYNIPLNVSAYTALAPRLDRLMEVHGVSFGLNSRKRTLTSNADELELFFHVSRMFQPLFETQVLHRRTKVYVQSAQSDDPLLSEAARVRMKIEDQHQVYLKQADWVDNRVLYPTIDPAQEARTTALTRFGLDHGIDEVLSVETNFCERDDLEFARLSLKQRAEVTREPVKVQSSKVASHVEGELYTAQGWKTVYRDPVARLRSSGGGSGSGAGAGSSGGGSGSGSGSGSGGKSGKLTLGNLAPVAEKDDDSSVQGVAGGKAVAGTKDALLSYCYLRLLEIRQSKLQVRQYLNMFRSIERTLMLDLSASDRVRKQRTHKGCVSVFFVFFGGFWDAAAAVAAAVAVAVAVADNDDFVANTVAAVVAACCLFLIKNKPLSL